MPERDRRRVMRLDVLWHAHEDTRDAHAVHLLDISPLGVRVAHWDPWSAEVVCAVELPPALGPVRLPGRVVWTRLRVANDSPEEQRYARYESGVEFLSLTPEQSAALALALAAFRAAQAGLGAIPTDIPPAGPEDSSS